MVVGVEMLTDLSTGNSILGANVVEMGLEWGPLISSLFAGHIGCHIGCHIGHD